MDFNALIAELRASSENLPSDSADRSLLSSVYCNKACSVLDQIAETTDYDNIITGLWLVAAHFAEQLAFLKPVPALSELCFKLFRQCAKAVLNIQWQNLEEDSSLRQNFLASLANLHAKLVPLDFPRFRLLEGLTENPWTNPTLAKVMGGEVEDTDKEEVRNYIEQEDPIILQLRVDMMLKENCEEYALNLCNSCLSHPELQSDLGVRKTQLSLLYKLGHEDKLQEECQKLNIQDAVRIIKQLQTSKTHRQICTVLAQTFMVQNWIRPSDMEANKELLRLWIRHQLLVDREHDQFKESVWAMAKLSQSTEQIIIFIDVLREECGETFLQLYVDMCIFAINVDKGQMETNKKEGNMEAAAARRSDMASICAKLSCLCHHASVKVARIGALTSFALKPTEQSFTKIGTFYGQGTDCCNKCGRDRNREPGTLNPATLYEVERLLNMLRPDYLSPDQSYINIQILCRRFLQESLKNSQQLQRKLFMSQNSTVISGATTTLVDGPVNKIATGTPCRPINVFEALSPQDFQNTQSLLNKMRLQNISPTKTSMSLSSPVQLMYQSGGTSGSIIHLNQQSNFSLPGQANKAQYVFDAERVKNKQPYGVPLEQQHQYYLIKHEKELEQRRKNAQKKREEKTQQSINLSSHMQPQIPRLLQQQRQQFPKHQHNEQVTQIIQTALKQDTNALQKLTHGASPGVVQAVLNIMKGSVLKASTSSNPQQQPVPQQIKPMASSSQHERQPLPTVSTLLKPSVPVQQLQKHGSSEQPLQRTTQSPPRRHPRPQLYAQPIMVSTSNSVSPLKYQPSVTAVVNSRNQVNQRPPVPSAISAGEKQKSENFMLAKSHIEDIRRFMQVQMSNLHQQQIAEPRQMSGSTVTMTNIPAANTSSLASFNLTNRPKTTVELAEQAALAKLQKLEHSKSPMFRQSQQLKNNNGQMFNNSQQEQNFAKTNEQHFVTSVSRADTNIQLQQTQHQQHQKLLNLHQHQNNVFSYNNSQNQSVAPNSALPSSDELSGSIIGIDDTIIKELLQDSGILANTFPDIEVDTIGEDKFRKMPDFSSLSQSVMPPLSNQISKSSKSHSYCYSTPQPPQTAYSVQTTQGNLISKVNHPPNVASTASMSGSFVQRSIRGMNSYSTLSTASSSINTMSQSSINKSLNTPISAFSGPSNQVTSSPQLWASNKFSVSISPRDNMSILPKKDIKQEAKPTVDQLREMMKKEDIQGEIYMDAANNATYRCIICSFAFETLDHLREHVRNVCKPGLQSSSVYNTKIKQDRANSAKAGVETTTVFQCLRCFELCVSDAGIKQHRLTCKRVPTVPSDIKKEVANNRQKPLPKPAVVIKQSPKKEQQDNSYKVPELPLPFPYPSLNAEAVLKSMSLSGSFMSETHVSHSNVGSKPPVTFSDVISGSTITISVPSSNISSKTPVTDSIHLPVPPAITCDTNTSVQTINSSVCVNTINPIPVCASDINTNIVPDKDKSVLPQNETASKETVSADTSLVERDLHIKDVETPTPTENEETAPQLRFTEITGSGGSKFYKCGTCSQTLCSFESFLVHWKECAVKNRNLIRKLELKEKPITGEILENLLEVVEAVAAGTGSISEASSLDSAEWDDLYSLWDPCKVNPLDMTGSGQESDSASWYEAVYSESHESMSESDSDVSEGSDERKTIDGIRFKDRRDGYDNGSPEEIGEEEDVQTFKKAKRKFFEDNSADESKSMSGSEQSYISTREAPPKLRDRKTLKPIQSFVNETLNSSFPNSTGKSTSAKLDEKMKDIIDEEKTCSETDAESDGDGLYCKVCQTSYQTKRILLQHFAGKHLQPYTVKTVADSSSYFCHLCQKTFSTFMHYMQHVPNHSVTIYEKMKVFIASRKSTQRSERIASQRGLTKKSNLLHKMSKTLTSKKTATKSAVDRLKQQLLAGKTQSVRDRLRISKRKRSLPSTFSSSEDDYSSDASNNVVFKSKKSTESENWSDGQKSITKSRNTRPRRLQNQSHHDEDNSSINSSLDQSGDDSDRGPKLARVRDDDYVLSEDFDSDGTDTKAPPTTRSRKRFVQSLTFSKKKKLSYDFELNEEINSQHKKNAGYDKQCFYDTNLSESETSDSNCSVLILSQNQNGNFVPCNKKLDTLGSCDTTSMKDVTKAVENTKELEPTRTLFVRSLNKKQKEWLTSCNLYPTVVLKMQCVDNLDKFRQDSALITPDKQRDNSVDKQCVTATLEANESCISNEASTSAPTKSKSSSFLDSFLSYLNQYPSSEIIQQGRKRNTSGPPGIKGLQKRRSSLDRLTTQVTERSQSPVIPSRSSITEMEVSESILEPDTRTSNSSLPSTENSQDSVKNILSKFPIRQCTVNLGQKFSLVDLKANRDQLSNNKTAMLDKSSSSGEVISCQKGRSEISNAANLSTKSSRLMSEQKHVPVVCLKRSDKIDIMIAIKPLVATSDFFNEKNSSSTPLASEPKPTEYKGYMDSASLKDTARTNEKSQSKCSQRDKGSNLLNISTDYKVPSSNLSEDLNCQQVSGLSTIEVICSTSMDNINDISQSYTIDSFHSKQKVPDCVDSCSVNISSVGIIVSSKLEDSRNSINYESVAISDCARRLDDKISTHEPVVMTDCAIRLYDKISTNESGVVTDCPTRLENKIPTTEPVVVTDCTTRLEDKIPTTEPVVVTDCTTRLKDKISTTEPVIVTDCSVVLEDKISENMKPNDDIDDKISENMKLNDGIDDKISENMKPNDDIDDKISENMKPNDDIDDKISENIKPNDDIDDKISENMKANDGIDDKISENIKPSDGIVQNRDNIEECDIIKGEIVKCVSENVLEQISIISEHSVGVSNTGVFDVSGDVRSADNLIAHKDCQDLSSGEVEKDLAQFVENNQTSNLNTAPGTVEMSCFNMTVLRKTEHDDTSSFLSAEIEKSQSLPQQECDTVETGLLNCFSFQNSNLLSNSEQGVTEKVKLTDIMDSQKPTAQNILHESLESERGKKVAYLSSDMVENGSQILQKCFLQSDSCLLGADISLSCDTVENSSQILSSSQQSGTCLLGADISLSCDTVENSSQILSSSQQSGTCLLGADISLSCDTVENSSQILSSSQQSGTCLLGADISLSCDTVENSSQIISSSQQSGTCLLGADISLSCDTVENSSQILSSSQQSGTCLLGADISLSCDTVENSSQILSLSQQSGTCLLGANVSEEMDTNNLDRTDLIVHISNTPDAVGNGRTFETDLTPLISLAECQGSSTAENENMALIMPIESHEIKSSVLIQGQERKKSVPIKSQERNTSGPFESQEIKKSVHIENRERNKSVPIESQERKSTVPIESQERKKCVPIKSHERKKSVPIESQERKSAAPIESQERKTAVPIESEVRKTSVTTKSQERKTSVSTKSQERKKSVPIESGVRKTSVSTKSQERKSAAPIESQERKIVVPIESEVRKTSVSTKSQERKKSVPIESGVRKTSVPFASHERKTAVHIESQEKKTAVHIESQKRKTSVPIESQEKKRYVPIENQQINKSVPIESQKIHKSVPIESQETKTPVPIENQERKSAVSVENQERKTSVPLESQERKTSVPIESQERKTSVLIESQERKTSVPIESQERKTSPIKSDKDDQTSDQLFHTRNKSSTFTETVQQLQTMNSPKLTFIVDNAKQVLVECQDDQQANSKQVNTSRDELGILDSLVLHTESNTSNKMSVESDNTMKACVFDGLKQSTVLLTKEEQCKKESVGSSKLNMTHKKLDKKNKVILNPTNSLAAFIAERLRKEDLEPVSVCKMNQIDRSSVRQIDEDSPLDISPHFMNQPIYTNAPGEDPSLDVGSHLMKPSIYTKAPGEDSSFNIGPCVMKQPIYIEPPGESSSLDDEPHLMKQPIYTKAPGESSSLDIGFCKLMTSVCVETAADDDKPTLEIGQHVVDNTMLVQSSSLVDYSSSEGEEDLECYNRVRDGDINLQQFEKGQLCTSERAKASHKIVRHNSPQALPLSEANCIHSMLIQDREGELQEVKKDDIFVGIHNIETRLVISKNKVNEEVETCLTQCNTSIDTREKGCCNQEQPKPVRNKESISQDQSKNCEVISEVIARSNQVKHLNQFEKRELQDTVDQHTSQLDTKTQCTEEICKHEIQVIDPDSFGETATNLKESTSGNVILLLNSGKCKQVLPVAKVNNSIALNIEGSDNTQSFNKEGNDFTVMSISNEDKFISSDTSHLDIANETSTLTVDKLTESMLESAFQEKEFICRQQQQIYEEKTDRKNLFNTDNSPIYFTSTVTMDKETLTMSQINHGCGEDKLREVLDVGSLSSEKCRENIELEVSGENYGRTVEKDDILSNTAGCRNSYENIDKRNICQGGKHSELSEENVVKQICKVVTQTTHTGNRDTEGCSVGLDEVDLLTPFHKEYKTMKDQDLYTQNMELMCETFVSHAAVLDYKNVCYQPKCSNEQNEEDSESNVLIPHGSCKEQILKLDQISTPSSQDKSEDVQCSLSGTNHTTKLHANLDQQLSLNTTSMCETNQLAQSEGSYSIEGSNFASLKLTDNFLTSEREVTSSNFIDIPKTEEQVYSEQLSTSERASTCLVPCNNIGKLFSEDNGTDKEQIDYTQKRLVEELDISSKNVKSGPKDKDLKSGVHIAEYISGDVQLYSKVEIKKKKFDDISGIERTEEKAGSPQEDKPTTREHGDKTSDRGHCENHTEIRNRSCNSSQMIDGINPGLTAEIKFQTLKHDEQAVSSANNVDTFNKNDSPSEKKNTDNETDEGDDFSDFDLVIENDTSHRSLSFPITLEKKSYSVPLNSSSSYISKGKMNYIPPSSGANIPTSGMPYNKIYSSHDHQSLLVQQTTNLSLIKPMIGAMHIRKSSNRQFVWDADDDSGVYKSKLASVSSTIPFKSSVSKKGTSSTIEAISNPAIEALKRKQKALRDKTETAPFTWDLEDYTDNSMSNARGRLTVQSSAKTANDILSFCKSNHERHQNSSVNKVHKRIAHKRRPLTPDVSHGKIPAKFRRTSSVDKHSKNSSPSVGKELKKRKDVEAKCEQTVNMKLSLNDPGERCNINDISFKKDSFSQPLVVISSIDAPSPQSVSLSGSETKLRRRERSQKRSHIITSQSLMSHLDEKLNNSILHEEVDPLRNQPALRSRHSSVESNISDKSATSKRLAEGTLQVSYKRFRKNDDSLTPKLKKIGLIKISKDSNSPPPSSSSSGTDSTAPMTRSSEAAIKAFNQKSLRSRGINLVLPAHSQQSSSTSKIMPQNVHPKSSPETSSKPKGSSSLQKLSSLSPNVVQNPSAETKTETSPRSCIRKTHILDTATGAVVSRRSSSIVVSTNSPSTLRSRKSITDRSKSHHMSASTTIFLVDPLPATSVTKGTFRSQIASQNTKGIRTLHTPLPAGTSAVRPKKDTSKQHKWKINTETKLARGKKQHRGPLSFKRT